MASYVDREIFGNRKFRLLHFCAIVVNISNNSLCLIFDIKICANETSICGRFHLYIASSPYNDSSCIVIFALSEFLLEAQWLSVDPYMRLATLLIP